MLCLLLLCFQDVALPDSVVTAPRSRETVTTSAAKTTVVTGAQLQETGARSLPTAIGQTTGVWIQESNMGGGAPVVRGLLGNKVLIMVDGVRINDSTTRYGPNQSLNTIDPAIVDRVVITKGISSVLYGSDAIGGVVSIWTKRRAPLSRDPDPEAQPFQVDLEAAYQSSSDGWNGSAAASYATEDHGFLGIVSGWSWGDLTAGNNTPQPFTGFDGYGLFGSWDMAFGPDKTLRASARVHRDFDVPRTDKLVAGFGQTVPTHEIWDYTLQDRRGYLLAYTDEKATSFYDLMELRLSVRSYEEQRSKQKTAGDTFTFEEDHVASIGFGADWRKVLGESHLVTYGLDSDHDEVDSWRRDTDLTTGGVTDRDGSFAPESRYTSLGVFAQDQFLGFDPWFVTLGLRYSYFLFSFEPFSSAGPGNGERESGAFDALTASLEVARDIGEDWTVTGTLAQGFRAPNLNDLAHLGNFGGGELPNADLVPEESLSAELAADVRKRQWAAEAAAWITHIDKYISRRQILDPDPDEDGDEIYQRANAGRALMWGAETGVTVFLLQGREDWQTGAAAAWVRGREYAEAPLDGVDMRRIPPVSGRFFLRHVAEDFWEYLRWTELSFRWAFWQDQLHPEDVSDPRINPNGTPGWSTLNLELGGPIGKDSDWRVGFLNLLDKHYRLHGSGIDGPGLTVVLGLNVGF